MTVGQRITYLRESLGYSAPEFAKLLGIHKSSMYRYEQTNINEKRDIPMSIAIEIAVKFNISLDWLAGLSDKMYRRKPTEVDSLVRSLTEEQQQEVLKFAKYIKEKENLSGQQR